MVKTLEYNKFKNSLRCFGSLECIMRKSLLLHLFGEWKLFGMSQTKRLSWIISSCWLSESIIRIVVEYSILLYKCSSRCELPKQNENNFTKKNVWEWHERLMPIISETQRTWIQCASYRYMLVRCFRSVGVLFFPSFASSSARLQRRCIRSAKHDTWATLTNLENLGCNMSLPPVAIWSVGFSTSRASRVKSYVIHAPSLSLRCWLVHFKAALTAIKLTTAELLASCAAQEIMAALFAFCELSKSWPQTRSVRGHRSSHTSELCFQKTFYVLLFNNLWT